MNLFLRSILALTLMTTVPALADDPAPAHDAQASEAVTHETLGFSDAFARATLPNAPVAGGYVTITNNGASDDRLVSASSPIAGDVQIHEMAVVDDVMTMRALPDGVAIPAGETVALEPGGLHLMFMQLREPFVEGGTVPLTLVFEAAGSVEVELAIVAAGGRAMPHGDHGDHAHDDAAANHHGD